MNTMTWLDLYQFLYQQANNSSNVGNFDWNTPVLIHDAETGDEYECDTYFISHNNDEKPVLVIKPEAIFS